VRFNLVLVAAAVAAAAGVGYTLLTGAQVPTERSCVAALPILAGIALGRDAISIRLIAVGRSWSCFSAPKRSPARASR
jgi:competence protein ComEC